MHCRRRLRVIGSPSRDVAHPFWEVEYAKLHIRDHAEADSATFQFQAVHSRSAHPFSPQNCRFHVRLDKKILDSISHCGIIRHSQIPRRSKMNFRVVLTGTVLALCTVTVFGQACVSPKYVAGTHHELLPGNTSPQSKTCLNRCTAGPMVMTPRPIDACEGETISPNIFIQGNAMSNFGDHVENAGGSIDWNDGKSTDLTGCCQWHPSHSFDLARNYCISATYGEQHNNSTNPPGGCSYRCRLSQNVPVVVHLKSSPECATGKYLKRASNKKKSAGRH